MSGNQDIGGARPALAAHSKDASAPGQTQASSAKPEEKSRESSTGCDAYKGVKEGVEHVRAAAEQAAETISAEANRTVEQASEYVRQQPFTALALISVLSLAVGVFIGRRSNW